MLTDDDRNHLLSIADAVASLHAVDGGLRRDHCLAAAERLRAIAAPRVATVGELLATATVDDGAPPSVTGAPDGTMVSIDRNATNPVVVAISKPVGRGRIWWGQRHLTVKEARMLARAVGAAADEIERGRGLVR